MLLLQLNQIYFTKCIVLYGNPIEGTKTAGCLKIEKEGLPLLELMGIFQLPFLYHEQVLFLQNFLPCTWSISFALQE